MSAALFPACAGSGARIGLGGAPLGNLFAAVAEDTARRLLDAAWASGCRSFDTAPHYGNGLSERRLGDALRTVPRDDFVLSTKVGRLLAADPAAPRAQNGYVDVLPFRQRWDFSAGAMRRSLEDSLQRLGLARIDVVFVHDCDAVTHGARADTVRRHVIDQALPALQQLKREGLIRAVGLGVNEVGIVLDVLRDADLDALMLAGRYSLLDHAAMTELLPLCSARGVRVALGGAFNSGLLATGTRSGATLRFNYAAASVTWVERTARIEAICAAHAVPLRAAALQFPLAHPAIDVVMVGARSAAEWHDALAAVQQAIPAAFWRDLREAGLLPAQAPTP